MQNKRTVGILVMLLSLSSCSLTKTTCEVEATATETTGSRSIPFVYSDSIDAIFTADCEVHLYDMADFMASDSTMLLDSVFTYKIKKDMGILGKEEKGILRFIISDKQWYIKDYAPIRQPFHPNITVEFIQGKSKAFMFFSFGSEEVAIADEKGGLKFFQMREKRQLARWASLIFPDESYYKTLIKL